MILKTLNTKQRIAGVILIPVILFLIQLSFGLYFILKSGVWFNSFFDQGIIFSLTPSLIALHLFLTIYLVKDKWENRVLAFVLIFSLNMCVAYLNQLGIFDNADKSDLQFVVLRVAIISDVLTGMLWLGFYQLYFNKK